MKCHRFLVCFETYLTPIIQFVPNISLILQTWQNDQILRLFEFCFHQKSFTTICELSWMPTTESILSSWLRSVPPCRLRPPVLSDHIGLAHWVVVIYRFYCIGSWLYTEVLHSSGNVASSWNEECTINIVFSLQVYDIQNQLDEINGVIGSDLEGLLEEVSGGYNRS